MSQGLGKMQKTHKDSTREMFSENERTCTVENAERIKGDDTVLFVPYVSLFLKSFYLGEFIVEKK